jgi:hypothetical protein
MQNRTLEETIYLWFAANNTSGSGDDGASAVFDVREGGALSSAAPVLSGNATLLTHANYPAGSYEVAVAATAANGFAANKDYGVFCTLAVSAQNPTGFVGGFRLAPVPSVVSSLSAAALAQMFTVDTGQDYSDAVAGSVLYELARRALFQPNENNPPALSVQDVFNGLVASVNTVNGKIPDPTYMFGEVSDVSPTTTEFGVSSFSLPFSDDLINGCYLIFTEGDLKGVARVIETYTASPQAVTFAAEEAWPQAPLNGQSFIVKGRPGLTAAKIIVALKADTEWRTLLANANGDWTLTAPGSFPGTGTLVLKSKDGLTTYATFTLTFNADGVVTERASA